MIEEDYTFIEIKKLIETQLIYAFDKLETEGQETLPLLHRIQDNEKLDFDDLPNKDPFVCREWIDDFKDQNTETATFQDFIIVGIIKLDRTSIRTFLTKSPQECLDNIKRKLPEYTYDELSRIIDEVKEISDV